MLFVFGKGSSRSCRLRPSARSISAAFIVHSSESVRPTWTSRMSVLSGVRESIVSDASLVGRDDDGGMSGACQRVMSLRSHYRGGEIASQDHFAESGGIQEHGCLLCYVPPPCPSP